MITVGAAEAKTVTNIGGYEIRTRSFVNVSYTAIYVYVVDRHNQVCCFEETVKRSTGVFFTKKNENYYQELNEVYEELLNKATDFVYSRMNIEEGR